MKYNVGDKVRVRCNWMADANDSMIADQEARDKFAGNIYTVTSVDSSGLNGDVYFTDAPPDKHGHFYGWYGEQLDPVYSTGGVVPHGSSVPFGSSDTILSPKQVPKVLLGVSPDEPVIENEQGGKQSDTPYGFHLLPVRSVFAAAKVAKYGADKYGETFENRNYTKISPQEHVNHAIQHLYAYLAGDTQDDHLGHAIVRCMFAYDTAKRGEAS